MVRITPYDPDAYLPGQVGDCVRLMSRFYSATLGVGRAFELDLASSLAEFLVAFRPRRDGFWTVQRTDADGAVVGCAALDGRDPAGAVLRWVYLCASVRGHGIGQRLLGLAISAARTGGHHRIVLTTHQRLHAAVQMYKHAGFQCTSTSASTRWGVSLALQHLELGLAAYAAPRTARPATTGLPDVGGTVSLRSA